MGKVMDASNRVAAFLIEQGVDSEFHPDSEYENHLDAGVKFCDQAGVDFYELNHYAAGMAARLEEGIEAGVEPAAIAKGAVMSAFFVGLEYGAKECR